MLIIALVSVFICVALVSGLVAQQVAARSAPTSRRLRGLAPSAAGAVAAGSLPLTETPDPTLSRCRARCRSRRRSWESCAAAWARPATTT